MKVLPALAAKALSQEASALLSAADTLYVSACSLFEISLKAKRGALDLSPFPTGRSFWERALARYAIESAPVRDRDFDAAAKLPEHH